MFNAEQSVAHCDTTTLLMRDMMATECWRSNLLKIAFERQSHKLIRSLGAAQHEVDMCVTVFLIQSKCCKMKLDAKRFNSLYRFCLFSR